MGLSSIGVLRGPYQPRFTSNDDEHCSLTPKMPMNAD